MIYEMVLNNGKALKCYAENMENILEMIFRHDIYVVQENEHPNKVSYVLPENVSHFRFNKNDSKVDPVI
jgi:hypothetical protein